MVLQSGLPAMPGEAHFTNTTKASVTEECLENLFTSESSHSILYQSNGQSEIPMFVQDKKFVCVAPKNCAIHKILGQASNTAERPKIHKLSRVHWMPWA